MAQYKMNTYDADVYIPEFKGLMQYGDQMGSDLRFSPECLNCETPGGVLQPATMLTGFHLSNNGNLSFNVGANRQATMMYALVKHILSQPFVTSITVSDGTNTRTIEDIITPNSEYYLYVFAIGSKLYSAATRYSLDSYLFIEHWNGQTYFISTTGELPVTELSGTYSATAKWSWCTYEMDFSHSALVGPQGTSNILILSNPVDGAYYCYDKNGIHSLGAPSKFSFIARYAERIWGVGTGNEKDSIYYSKAFNATDWTPDADIPADGGGVFREPTFDEDKFVALVPFADMLIAFTQERAWRITGSDPSSFTIQEQYGNGTKYPFTISVLEDRIIMLGDHGLVTYDGTKVYPFLKENTYEFLHNIKENGSNKPAAMCVKGKYILSLSNEIIYKGTVVPSIDDSGYKFLVYDSMDGSVTLEDRPEISSFCAESSNMAYAVTHYVRETSTNRTYARYDVVPLRFDSWDKSYITNRAVKWVTPWITLGRKDIQKGGFDMYFYPELAENAATGVTFKFSIQTEKKTKTKSYTVAPLTAEQKAAGKKYRQKRLHFGGAGRRFRLIIEVAAGNTIPWRLIGGIHIIAEIDKD